MAHANKKIISNSVIITIGNQSLEESVLFVRQDYLELLKLTKDHLLRNGFDDLRHIPIGEELESKLYEMQENCEGFTLKFETFWSK